MRKLSERITRIIDLFYIKPLRKIIPQQTFRYAACGGANMLLGYIIYYILFHYVVRDLYIDFGFTVMYPKTIALTIQFIVTFFVGFWLNRYVTFSLSPLRGRVQLFRYILSSAGSFLLSWLLLKLFSDGCGIYPTIAKLIIDPLVVIYSYLMARFFTFSGSGEKS